MDIQRKEAIIVGVKDDLAQVLKDVEKGIAMYLLKVFLPNLFKKLMDSLEESLRKRL